MSTSATTTNIPPCSNHPLEAGRVERLLRISVEGHTVTGTASANWGAVEVTVTSPITGLTRGRDGRSWAFAMLCHNCPDKRFALGGQFTPGGIETAKQLLTDLFRDWLAVSRHEAEVDAECRRTRQELANLDRDFEARRIKSQQERQAIRRAFKTGELTQRMSQAKLKALGKMVELAENARWEAERLVCLRFTSWIEKVCGRDISLEEAETLLAEVAVIVETRATPEMGDKGEA